MNDALSGLGLQPLKLSVDVDTDEAKSGLEKFTEGFGQFKGVAGSVDGVVNSMTTLVGSLEEGSDAWTVFMNVVGVASSVLETVSTIMEVVTALSQSHAAAKQQETAAEVADTSAKAANTAAGVAEAAVSETVTAAKGGEAISKVTASGAALPFPANIAAIAAGIAAVVAALATVAFANGGIVPGSSTSGDRVLARVNSGEMILNTRQQARLFALLNGTSLGVSLPRGGEPSVALNMGALAGSLAPVGGGKVEFEVRGSRLVGVLANETRLMGKSGRRSNIL